MDKNLIGLICFVIAFFTLLIMFIVQLDYKVNINKKIIEKIILTQKEMIKYGR